MPLFDAVTNTTVQIWRRGGEDAGGDQYPELLHSGLLAFAEQVSEYQRDLGGRLRTITGKILLPPFDLHGAQVDVQAGDRITFNDYRDIEQEREVVVVKPEHVFGILDYIVVEVA